MNNNTIEILDQIGFYINLIKQEEIGRGFKGIVNTINDAEMSQLMPKDLVQGYRQILQNFKQNYDKEEMISALDRIYRQHMEEIENPDEKIQKDERSREFRAKDIQKEPKVFSKTREGDLTKEEKEEERRQNKRSLSEHTIDSLTQALQRYTQSVKNRSIDDSLDSIVALGDEIKAVAKAGVISEEMAEEMFKPLREVQKSSLSYDLHEGAVKSLNDIVKQQLQKSDNKFGFFMGKQSEKKHDEKSLSPNDKLAGFFLGQRQNQENLPEHNKVATLFKDGTRKTKELMQSKQDILNSLWLRKQKTGDIGE